MQATAGQRSNPRPAIADNLADNLASDISRSRRFFSMKSQSGKNRKRKLQPSMPRCSPLLEISSSRTKETQDWPSSDGGNVNGCNETDTMQVQELCHSPGASRRSVFMFHTTPETHRKFQFPKDTSPADSPDLPHQDLSQDRPHDSPQLSDESPLSSPESTPLVSSNPISVDRRRYMIINEIITTESRYIDNLNVILSLFMPAFEHVVAPRDLRLLIPAQLEMLVESHQELLTTLKQRMRSETTFYGDIFSRLCGPSNVEFFNLYYVYMGEFKLAMRTLAHLQRESAQFKEILCLLQQSPLCERLSLASYLLTPIQRLPRYELLLKELLKHTPADHPDYNFVEEAVACLHRELTKLNLSIKSCQLACPENTKNSVRMRGKISRRPLSMLRRFVSAANINDYSSGDSSYANDDSMKPPPLRPSRRLSRAKERSASFCDSDADLSSSFSAAPNMSSRRGALTVSCSDLRIEFDSQPPKLKFRLLPALPSETCTPESLRHENSPRNSFLFASNSSLSSLEDGKKDCRPDSLTPTTSTPRPPTPLSAECGSRDDATLKLSDSFRYKAFVDSEERREEGEKGRGQESEERGEGDKDTGEESTHTEKNTWRLSLFKKRKNNSKRELKYLKH